MIRYHFVHNLFINGAGNADYSSPQVYEHEVRVQLDRMHRARTGRALLTEIRKRTGTHTLMIVPYNNHKEDNAYASPAKNDWQHATKKGGLERYNGNVKNSPYDKKAGHDVDETGLAVLGADGKAIQGLGGGTNSVVTYSPTTWYKHIHDDKGHKNSSGAQPDEILLHEMVHAVRQMRGIAESLYVGSLYDTEEEFFAFSSQTSTLRSGIAKWTFAPTTTVSNLWTTSRTHLKPSCPKRTRTIITISWWPS